MDFALRPCNRIAARNIPRLTLFCLLFHFTPHLKSKTCLRHCTAIAAQELAEIYADNYFGELNSITTFRHRWFWSSHQLVTVRTDALARFRGACCRGPRGWIRFRQRRDADAPRACSGYGNPPSPAAAGGAGAESVGRQVASLAAAVSQASVLAVEQLHQAGQRPVDAALATAALRLSLQARIGKRHSMAEAVSLVERCT